MKRENLLIFFENYITKILLALFGVFGTLVTIYAFYYDQKVDLKYDIISSANVFDLNANVSDLQIKYQNTDLRQTSENLRYYTIKVVNNGTKDILIDYYDEQDLLGLKIKNGKIIKCPVIIQTSSAYLSKNTKIHDFNYNQFHFNKVILDCNEYFVVEFLVLHKTNFTPSLESIGKIVGVKNIDINNSLQGSDKDSIFKQIFYGSIAVQIIRLVAYFFCAVLLIYFLVKITELYYYLKRIVVKRNIVKKYKKINLFDYSQTDEVIFRRYRNGTFFHLLLSSELLSNMDNLNEVYNNILNQITNRTSKEITVINHNGEEKKYGTHHLAHIEDMIQDGLIYLADNKLVINPKMTKTLQKFVKYAKTITGGTNNY